MDEQLIKVDAGLKGVIVGESKLSDVAEGGSLIYRGYDINDLAEHSSFEEVAYLLLRGELPTAPELKDFTEELSQQRDLPSEVIKLFGLYPREAHPMDMLGTAVNFLSLYDHSQSDISYEANIGRATSLIAKFPALVANSYRVAHGQPYVMPKAGKSQAWNFLYMLHGSEPDEQQVRLIDTTMILYAEHGTNASTYVSRCTASTRSNLYSAVASGIGTLKGELHGGANEKAMAMLLEIGDPARAEEWVMDVLAENQRLKGSGEGQRRIMGFGHREYKHGDPRARILKRMGKELLEGTPEYKWYELADTVEKVMAREKGLFPNVDFPCAYVYYGLGIPVELYTPMFAMSRISGWSAHVIEQQDNNVLVRPKVEYTGPAQRPYVPIDRR